MQGGVLERSIPAGRYDVYAVANLHEDMGGKQISKKHPAVGQIYEAIVAIYDTGRTT